MLENLGWLKRIFVKNSGGTVINPATEEKQAELKTALENIYDAVDGLEVIAENIKIEATDINLNTDTLEAKVQSVRDQLDVVLSSRASEVTVQAILDAIGQSSGSNLISELQSLVASLDVDLSTLATEATLIQVRDYLDTVETKLASLITVFDVALSTRASEATLLAVLDAIGPVSGTDIITELQNISNAIAEGATPYPGKSFRTFTENGGSSDMNIDGSSTPVEFSIAPPTGKIWYVYKVTVILEDTGITFNKFGGIAPALTNGVDFKVQENGASEVTLANIKTNAGFYAFANDIQLETSTTDFFTANIDVHNNTGTTLKLVDSNSDYLKIVVNDNLTGLNQFKVLVRGYEVDE